MAALAQASLAQQIYRRLRKSGCLTRLCLLTVRRPFGGMEFFLPGGYLAMLPSSFKVELEAISMASTPAC